MRFDMRHEVWTDGTQVAVVWDNGHVCVYQHRPGDETPELVGWLDPEEGKWPWGRPPPSVLDRWRAACGWPDGAVDAAGPWALQPDGDGRRLVGERAAVRRVVHGRSRESSLPGRPDRVSALAHLVNSPEGTVLIDAMHGLVWSLEAGVAHVLGRVNEESGLQAVRVPGGVVVHFSFQHRQGGLLRIDDGGTVDEAADTYGFTCPLAYVDGRVHGVLPAEGTWRVPGGETVTTTVGGHVFTRLDPVRLELDDEELSGIPLDYGPWVTSCAGGLWVAADGHTLVILERLGGTWVERYDRLRPPKGESTRLAGRSRLAHVQPLAWEGSPGPFEVRTSITNVGESLVGMQLRVTAPPTVRPTTIVVGDEPATVLEGRARFSSVPLPNGRPVRLVVQGMATGPGVVGLRAVRPRVAVAHAEDVLGDLTLEVVVRSGLRAARDGKVLALQPVWTAELGRRGQLDADTPEPDLTRWLRRALSRCRVPDVASDPEGVRDEWLRMSARDRAAAPTGRVPAYKLASGRHWSITAPEAARIAEALGPDHPLGAFAAAGPFEILGDDPLAGA